MRTDIDFYKIKNSTTGYSNNFYMIVRKTNIFGVLSIIFVLMAILLAQTSKGYTEKSFSGNSLIDSNASSVKSNVENQTDFSNEISNILAAPFSKNALNRALNLRNSLSIPDLSLEKFILKCAWETGDYELAVKTARLLLLTHEIPEAHQVLFKDAIRRQDVESAIRHYEKSKFSVSQKPQALHELWNLQYGFLPYLLIFVMVILFGGSAYLWLKKRKTLSPPMFNEIPVLSGVSALDHEQELSEDTKQQNSIDQLKTNGNKTEHLMIDTSAAAEIKSSEEIKAAETQKLSLFEEEEDDDDNEDCAKAPVLDEKKPLSDLSSQISQSNSDRVKIDELADFPLADYPSKKFDQPNFSRVKNVEPEICLLENSPLADYPSKKFDQPNFSMVKSVEPEICLLEKFDIKIDFHEPSIEKKTTERMNSFSDKRLKKISDGIDETATKTLREPSGLTVIKKPGKLSTTNGKASDRSLEFLNPDPIDVKDLENEVSDANFAGKSTLAGTVFSLQELITSLDTRAVGITSSSDISCRTNFAFLLAKEFVRNKYKTLIIDADFDKPRLNLFTDEPCIYGLRHLIDKSNLEKDIYVKSEFGDVYLLPSGTPSLETQAKMNLNFWYDVLSQAKISFEVILIVLPELKKLENIHLYNEKVIYLTLLDAGLESSISEFYYSRIILKRFDMKAFIPIKIKQAQS
ncbi:MAG: hypothetical protein Kow0029_27290 [Candidatus Rifleibacteriota bacterium]